MSTHSRKLEKQERRRQKQSHCTHLHPNKEEWDPSLPLSSSSAASDSYELEEHENVTTHQSPNPDPSPKFLFQQRQEHPRKNTWHDYVVTISHPFSSLFSSPVSSVPPSSSSSPSSSSPSFTPLQFPSLQFVLNICLVLVILLTITNFQTVSSCNEAVCASIVSKCTLTQSCKCEMKNCTCCRECFDCLSYLYSECCSCVELCPKPNNTNHVIMHSQVGDLKEPMPDLFNILTEETDLQGRWTTFTFPIDIDQSWFQPKPETPTTVSTNAYTIADGKITIDPNKDIVTVNCTVAYMSQCMPLNKCKNSCHSMGSSYFRWFHNGCCECVGTCINYGINESRCSQCAADIDEDDEDPPEVSPAPAKEEASEETKPESVPSTDEPPPEAAVEAPESTKEATPDDGEPT